MTRANFGQRVAALLIDAAGVAITAIIFGKPLFNLADSLGLVTFASIDTSAEAIMIIILSLWSAAWVYMLSDVAAATPGKALMRLTIRREDGHRAGLGRRLGRYLLKCSALLVVLPFGIVENIVASGLFLLLGLAAIPGYLMILGSGRQTLYDRLSRTAVYRRPTVDRP
jgi:uncharacterized RDD family membrane protein YckC